MAHPVEILRQMHHPPQGYPSGVIPVPNTIPGRAFFPGGSGLWSAAPKKPLPEFPFEGCMVLGHDFHSEAGYRRSLALGYEPETLPTWKHLVPLLERENLDLNRCFFTNFFMGLREGNGSTGSHPGKKNNNFVEHCRRFLIEQIKLQKPKLILILGIQVPCLVAPLSSILKDWEVCKNFKDIDKKGSLRKAVSFAQIRHFSSVVAVLTHPSYRTNNVRYRRYQHLSGESAEAQILRDAILEAQIL